MTELVLKGLDGLRRGYSKIDWVWLLTPLMLLTVAVLDPPNLAPVTVTFIDGLLGTAPYIALAVVLVAWLKATGAEVLVAHAFEGREVRMIFLAALFGGLAPFCSCEVIPFIAGLLAVGAPLSAVMAFWLSSPLIDPATALITAAALGWEFAIGKTVAAVALGLMGGFGILVLQRAGLFADPLRPRTGGGGCCGASPFKGEAVWKFWREDERKSIFRAALIGNTLFLIKWLSLAYVLEGLLITYVPAEAIGSLVGGDGVVPIAVAAAVGAPAYLNSYAAPALVAGLMEQGMSAGAAMAFMVAGAVSCIPAMAAVWSLVKRPVFMSYVGFGYLGAVLIGILFAALV